MLQGFNEKRDSLSTRQLRVMQGKSLGLENEEIAELLDISPSTVTEHRRRAYAKLRCHNGHEAEKWLKDKGYYVTKEQFDVLCNMDSPAAKQVLVVDEEQEEYDRRSDKISRSIAEGYRQMAEEFNRGIYG